MLSTEQQDKVDSMISYYKGIFTDVNRCPTIYWGKDAGRITSLQPIMLISLLWYVCTYTCIYVCFCTHVHMYVYLLCCVLVAMYQKQHY